MYRGTNIMAPTMSSSKALCQPVVFTVVCCPMAAHIPDIVPIGAVAHSTGTAPKMPYCVCSSNKGTQPCVRLFDGGHQTKTTKSRLNAILAKFGEQGDRVFAKSFDWFITMNTVQGPTTVPFFSSMRLG
mgnify:CR=1 FL=1